MAGVTTRAEATHRRDPDEPVSYWLRGPAPAMDPPLEAGEALEVDVAIVGGGFTGLWTAIALTDTDPALRVAVLEAETVAFGASGRNGGFCEASLTHGLANGIRHFPDELERLEREGIDNLQGLIAFTREHGIDCDLEETGTLSLADQPYQVEEFRAWVDEAAEHGEHLEFLDRAAVQAEIHSPLWQAGLYRPPGRDVVLDPAALCRGIARVARERGVRVHEGTAVTRLERRAGGVLVRTASGATVRAGQVVVATSAYSGVAAPPGVALRAGLRLRPRVRSRSPPTSGGPSAGRGARACPTRTTSSTTSGSPPTTGSCGAGTTPSTTRAAGSARSSTGGRPRSRSSRRSSSGPSRSSRGCASRSAGAARSTRPRGSRSRSGRRWAAA